MDYIKISNSKLKIMLTAEDMEKYEINTAAGAIQDIHVRRILRKLLNDAHVHSDFMCEDARLYVQFFPCSGGGCELFISRMENEGQMPLSHKPCLPEPLSKSKSLVIRDKEFGNTVYSFESLGDMISLCRRLCSVGFEYDSKAFMENDRKYYLFLCSFPPPSLYELDTYCFLCEYGTRQNFKQTESRMIEYGRVICNSDAVHVLGQL